MMRVLALCLALLLGSPALAAITFGTPTTAINGILDASSVTVNRPSGVGTDSWIMVVGVFNRTSGTTTDLSIASGFTKIGFNETSSLAYKTAVFLRKITDIGSEPATYQVDGPASSTLGALAVEVFGIDETTQLDADGTRGGGSGTTLTFNEVTTVTNGAMYVGVSIQQRTATVSDVDLTVVGLISGGSGTGAQQINLYVGALEIASAGATGAKTATSSTIRDYASRSLALRPAAGSSSAVPVILQVNP